MAAIFNLCLLTHVLAAAAPAGPDVAGAPVSDEAALEQEFDEEAELGQEKSEADDDDDDDEHLRAIVVHTETGSEIELEDTAERVEVISRNTIRHRGDMSVGDSIASRTGMTVSNSIGGGSIAMQGLQGRHILVLVDGQRVTGRIGGVLDSGRFTLEGTQQIEVTRGPSSLLYGSDAVGGIINLITRWPEAFAVSLRGGYGGFNRADAQLYVGYGNEALSGFVRGNFEHHDGFDLVPEDVATTGDRRLSFNYGGGLRARPNDIVDVQTQWNYRREELRGVDLAAGGAVFDRANRTEYVTGKLQPTFRYGDARTTLVLGWDHMRDQWMQDQRYDNALDQVQETLDHLATVDLRHEHLVADRHRIRAGYSLQLEWMKTPRLGVKLADRQRHAVYAQHEWIASDTPNIRLVTGIRADWDEHFGFRVTPRFALLVRPLDNFSVRAQFGRAYRAPDFKEMYMSFSNMSVGYRVAGNPDLEAETSTTTLLSADWQPINWLQLSTTIFDHRISNLITTEIDDETSEGSTTIYRYTNRDNARSTGFEFRTRIFAGPAKRAWVSTDLGYTLQDTFDDEREGPLSGRARHLARTQVAFHPPDWGTRLGVETLVIGPRTFYSGRGDSINVRETDTTTILNLRLRQSVWNNRFAIYGRASNLLDMARVDTDPREPRSWFVGVELEM